MAWFKIMIKQQNSLRKNINEVPLVTKLLSLWKNKAAYSP